jgi:peroxiredoxin
MYVVDGKIQKMFVEDGFADNAPSDPFGVSDADTMLAYLKTQQVGLEQTVGFSR